MNCNPRNRRDYLIAKMLGWRELASCGIDVYERARGRRNIRRLAVAHPDVAIDCGLGQLVDLSGGGTASGLDG
jgi:hypothetical protein